MYIGPWLVIRGTVVGIVGLVIFSLVITSQLSLPPVARAEGIPTETAIQIVEDTDNDQIETAGELSEFACEVNPSYPAKVTQWCGLITKYAHKNYLPPDLVAAVIWLESGGNPVAYSRSGAVGLMQVMPRDGIAASFMCVNGPCFTNRPSIAELNDPEFNIKYGTKMLAGLFNKHGNYRDALKAYGPMDAGYSYADKVLGIYERHIQ
jgi:soluble lytic murein transglycosylase-like protein